MRDDVRARPDLRAGLRGGFSQRSSEPSHAAANERWCARGCRIASRVEQQGRDGPGRPRPQVRAEHAPRGDGGAQDVGLEPVLGKVGHRHGRHAEEAVGVGAAEPTEPATCFQQMPELGGARAIEGRRDLTREVREQRRALGDGAMEGRKLRRVARGEPRQMPSGVHRVTCE